MFEASRGYVSSASMKVPPKRKGNLCVLLSVIGETERLNESPSEKEGKFANNTSTSTTNSGLNESPSEKEGK